MCDTASAARVRHVVTGHFQARAIATHQTGAHRTEAAEVYTAWHTRFLGSLLHMPMEQAVPIQRIAGFVGKHPIIRLSELRVLHPHPLHRREDDSMSIEGHLAFTIERSFGRFSVNSVGVGWHKNRMLISPHGPEPTDPAVRHVRIIPEISGNPLSWYISARNRLTPLTEKSWMRSANLANCHPPPGSESQKRRC